MTILVVGYYGFGNAGDEAILSVIVEQFRAAVPAVRLVVSSGNPLATAAAFAVETVAWNQLAALARAVQAADLIVIGGGGLFHDYWGADPDSLLTDRHWGIAYYAGCALLAALSGKPLMLYAVGVGPLFSAHGIRLTRAICDAASLITVRDPASREVLESIGVPRETMEVTADPALLYRPAATPSQDPLEIALQNLAKPVLGVAVRKWSIGVHPDFLERELAAALDAFLDETRGSVILFPFQEIAGEQENDRATAQRVAAHMRHARETILPQGPLSPDGIYTAFRNCDAILGMRLHALIFAATLGIPAVALSYDAKVDSFAGSLGIPTLDVKALDAGVLLAQLKQALSTKPDTAPLKRLCQRASRTSHLALELAGSRPAEPRLTSETLDLLRRAVASQIRIGESNQAALASYEARILEFDREHKTLGAQFQELDRRVIDLTAQLHQSTRQQLETIAEMRRFRASFQNELEAQRSQRAWQIMLLIRKAYTLLHRGSKPAFLRWAISAAAGKWGALGEYEPRFPDIAAYIPETVAPPAIPAPARNPPQRNRIDVVILAIIDFDFRFQRPQQIAAEMARRGHRVFWISPSRFLPPSSPCAYSIEPLRDNVWEVHLRCPHPDIYMGELRPDHLQAISGALAALFRDWDIGENIALIQLPFWRRVALTLRDHQGAKLLYDCMDDWETFQNMGPFNIAEERFLVKECDVLIVTGAELEEKYRAQGLAPVLIRNGADYDFFSQARANGLLSSIPKPIAGYFGAIADWIDLDLVLAVAQARPQYSFVLIGQVFNRDTTSLQALPNVFLLGNQRYLDIPSFLFHFDACLIPFLLNQVTKATDPVKLYEYFSLGKPVVATDMAELQQCAGLIYIGRGADDFARKLDRALTEQDATLRDRRIAFAQNNTWTARVDQIEAATARLFPLISILIVTYNSADFVRPCLDSILGNTAYPAYEAVVVDNASTDATVHLVEQYAAQDPRVRLIALSQNTGFAAGNNRAAREARGEFLVFLNADTMVTPGWLHHLLEHVQRDSSIGQICPVTNFAGNEAKINVSYRNFTEMEQFAIDIHRKHRSETMELRVAPLFCSLVPQAVWTRVGELDESFGMGMFEDDDFSMRIRAAGYRVVAAEDCFVHHFGQGSFSKVPSEAYNLLFEKNRRRMEEKWHETWQPHRTRAGVRPAFEEERFHPAAFVTAVGDAG